MKEDVLQYIWKTQSFNKSNLKTTSGEAVTIIKQGSLNDDAGPDFSGARIKINNVEWAGDVEIHTKSSTWYAHKHHVDPAYEKVIMHIVWQNDEVVLRPDGSEIPTIQLNPLLRTGWLHKYQELSSSLQVIPCQNFFAKVDDLHKHASFYKALIERLTRKSQLVLNDIIKLNGDWEQATINLLFEYFGFKKNNEAFKQLAQVTSYSILKKLSSVKQIEAYLFGMAGFLKSTNKISQYQLELQEEFNWLQRKFAIKTTPMSATWWKFMRLRPANFPTLRIAQLAALLYQRQHLFQTVLEVTPSMAEHFFKVNQSGYWKQHYHFGKEAKTTLKGLGEQSARGLSINVAAVLLVAYGEANGNEHFKERAVNFLEALKPEKNIITRSWQHLGIDLQNAAESQGAIELYNIYCKQKRCLSCNIGNQILQGK